MKFWNYIKEWMPYVICILLIILVRIFIITPVRVDGDSMVPTLANGQILLLKKYDKQIDRFDIVVLKHEKEKLIKRVIGLPGEHIKYTNNKLYINGKVYDEKFIYDKTSDFDIKDLGYDKIPDGYYFVVGDNRDNSLDSRYIGLIAKKDIKGITNFRLFPFSTFGSIDD